MTGFVSAKQSLGALQAVVGRQSFSLVDDKDTADRKS
jgi:hypothetical protein